VSNQRGEIWFLLEDVTWNQRVCLVEQKHRRNLNGITVKQQYDVCLLPTRKSRQSFTWFTKIRYDHELYTLDRALIWKSLQCFSTNVHPFMWDWYLKKHEHKSLLIIWYGPITKKIYFFKTLLCYTWQIWIH